jgi:hypothetical protein
MRILLCLLALVAVSLSSIAQTTKLKPNVGKPKPPKYATAGLDTALEVLPQMYPGHGCKAIATTLMKKDPIKSEYETTDAYKSRLAEVAETPLFDSLRFGDTVGFVPLIPFLKKTYTADASWMELEVQMLITRILETPTRKESVYAEILTAEPVSKSTYSGSNIFGKEVTVTKSILDVCAVIFANRDLRYSPARARFSIPPEEARVVADRLRVLYVGKLAEPYYQPYASRSAPTIDSPTETIMSGPGVVITLNQIWIFDPVTGKVYSKINQ